jgi:ATP-binding cassette, subfamily C (CFTR/MRP), member 1
VLPTTASNTKSDDPTAREEEKTAEEKPFELKNFKFKVTKGSFVAIVGRVGSGKVIQFRVDPVPIGNLFEILQSSLLQALIGEMRRTKGEVRFDFSSVTLVHSSLPPNIQVIFGGSVAYVPQSAWIRNATLRENIIFGREDNDKK